MHPTTIESDVLLAREGDEAAFGRLVESSASTVCSIALAIVRNVQASEDVAQEVFLSAWANLKKLRNPASFLPWLRQTARNQAHLWRREHARELVDEDTVAAALDGRPSQSDRILAAEERRVLGEALDQLPDEAREVLILYYREESSSRQVSTLLGISEDAVRQRLSRARGLLREEMLGRFAATVARTAPGAAFAGAVAGALTFAAPAASAAVLTSTAAGGLTGITVAKVTFFGAALGWFGVLLGMQYLEPVFDEEEGRALKRFRNTVLLVITAGGAAVALSLPSAWGVLISAQSMYAVLAFFYFVRLPRILQRRMEWEMSVNPETAKLKRRQWMWSTIGRAVGATIGGAFLMAMAVSMR